MNISPTQKLSYQVLECDLYTQKQLQVYVIRADKIHPQISGNKWYKLKYSLLQAQQNQATSVVSFGGAYSNHIHALAFAAKQLSIPAVGYIRGQWTDDNPTLQDAKRWGMTLKSLSRAEYREKDNQTFLEQLNQRHPGSIIIPEGGSNSSALSGVNDLMLEIEAMLPDLDMLVAACGTGGTLAGLISAAQSTSQILGIPVLKGAEFLYEDIAQLMAKAKRQAQCQWQLDLQGHYGGYGKTKREHLQASTALEQQHNISLEPIYTAKMWRRFDELVAQDYFAKGSKIALLHSGGLQGRRSFVDKYPDLFKT